MADSRPTTTEHVDRTRRLAGWLRNALSGDSEAPDSAAADLADIVYAAADVRELLEELLQCDLAEPGGRERAAQLATNIQIQLEEEIRPHVDSLLPVWKSLLQRLDDE